MIKHVLFQWRLRYARLIFTTLKNNVERYNKRSEDDRIGNLSCNIVDQGLVIDGEQKDHVHNSNNLKSSIDNTET